MTDWKEFAQKLGNTYKSITYHPMDLHNSFIDEPRVDTRCHSLNRKGRRCGNDAIMGSRFCRPHAEREHKLKKLSDEQIQQILEQHTVWVESSKSDGTQANLDFADLRGNNLSDTDLRIALIKYADLENAILRGTNFAGADLRNAWLYEADIENANFRDSKHLTVEQIQLATNWDKAIFSNEFSNTLILEDETENEEENEDPAPDSSERIDEVNLQGLDFRQLKDINDELKEQIKKAKNWTLAFYNKDILEEFGLPRYHNEQILEKNLKGLDIRDQNISDAILSRFNLSGSNLQGVTATNTQFTHADLTDANLRRAILIGADFSEANLRGADLFGADISSTTLSRANIQGANLQNIIGLKKQQVLEARNWRLAQYDFEMLAELGLSADHNERAQNLDFSQTDTLRAADLTDADLSSFNLYGANLEEANFKRTNLKDTNLQGANLLGALELTENQVKSAHSWVFARYSDAMLSTLGRPKNHNSKVDAKEFREDDLNSINFQGANLEHYDLRDSDLTASNLTETTGLTAKSLAGARVSNAHLPDAIKNFEDTTTAEELIRYTRKLFTLKLLFCFYALLTVITTTDLQLLTDSLSDPLPISRTSLPVIWLYAGIPLILLILYIYFHVNMQRLWESLSRLPSYFPDGRPMDSVVFPWIGNAVARKYLPQFKTLPPLHSVQTTINALMVWWMVPITLFLIFFRYLRIHDWTFTTLHILTLSISLSLALLFKQLAATTFRRYEPRLRIMLFAASLITFSTLFTTVSASTIEGSYPKEPVRSIREVFQEGNQVSTNLYDASRDFVLHQMPRLLDFLNFPQRASLASQEVSTKPANWDGHLDSVKAAMLEGKNLRYADATSAFLVKANLRSADLTGIMLNNSDLRGADLRSAQIEGADLRGIDLSYADLRWAEINQTNLWGANLAHADLRGATVIDSDLRSADLSNASMQGCDFSFSKLHAADFKNSQLSGCSFHSAILSNALLSNVDLQGVDLTNAQLTNSRFINAILWGTTLTDADLGGTVFKNSKLMAINYDGVNLQGADFSEGNQIDLSALKKGNNWVFAVFSPASYEELGFPKDFPQRVKSKDFSALDLSFLELRNADLRFSNLRSTDLSGSNLFSSDLRGANMAESKLDSANLQRADLREIKNLDTDELVKARNWSLALLDETLIAELNLRVDHNQRRSNVHFVDLSSEQLSNFNFERAALSHANLKDAKLDGSNLTNADLSSARLQRADLQNAVLIDANIREADLVWANLKGARGIKTEQVKSAKNWLFATYSPDVLERLNLPYNHNERIEARDFSDMDLMHADLSNQTLEGSLFAGSVLRFVQFHNSLLTSVDFTGADLFRAQMQLSSLKNADFRAANLQYANFLDSEHLQKTQVERSYNWPLGFYSKTMLEELGLPANHNDNLEKQSLQGYRLSGVDLRSSKLSTFNLSNADLSNANLTGANLIQANLSNTNISGAVFDEDSTVDSESIKTAKNWVLANYPPNLAKSLGLPKRHLCNIKIRNFSKYVLAGQTLEGADLQGYSFDGADLENASLTGSNLSDSSFLNSNLRNTNFSGVNLSGASFEDADLQGANFRSSVGLALTAIKKAKNWPLAYFSPDITSALGLPSDHNNSLDLKNLRGYSLPKTDFRGANLADFDLSNVDFSQANLQEANLSSSMLHGALLQGAELTKADLRKAKMQAAERFSPAANLTGANMEEADLRNAMFACAKLFCDSANLQSANLKGANIAGATFENTNIDGADFRGVIGAQPNVLIDAKHWRKALFDGSIKQMMENR